MRCLSGRYVLEDQVGRGGMAEVWRAHDRVLRRTVAVKVMSRELAAEAAPEQMRQEALHSARLCHPHIAGVYDYGETVENGTRLPFLVMEYVDGPTLAGRLAEGPLSWPEAVRICAEVADALAAAHEAGLVHRDIKPSNIMLAPAGVKVVDFGVAARTGHQAADAAGRVWGTPGYLPPEQWGTARRCPKATSSRWVWCFASVSSDGRRERRSPVRGRRQAGTGSAYPNWSCRPDCPPPCRRFIVAAWLTSRRTGRAQARSPASSARPPKNVPQPPSRSVTARQWRPSGRERRVPSRALVGRDEATGPGGPRGSRRCCQWPWWPGCSQARRGRSGRRNRRHRPNRPRPAPHRPRCDAGRRTAAPAAPTAGSRHGSRSPTPGRRRFAIGRCPSGFPTVRW